MYKLELNMVDNTDQSTLIIFSAEAEKMVDKDAPTLVQQIEQRVITVWPWTNTQQVATDKDFDQP